MAPAALPTAIAPPRRVRMARLRPPVNGESTADRPRRLPRHKQRRPSWRLSATAKRVKRGAPGWRFDMPLTMPALDEGVLKRRRAIVKALTAIVSAEGVIASSREMASYQ